MQFFFFLSIKIKNLIHSQACEYKNCSPQKHKVPTWQDHGRTSHQIFGPIYSSDKLCELLYPMREQVCYLQSVQGLEHISVEGDRGPALRHGNSKQRLEELWLLRAQGIVRSLSCASRAFSACSWKRYEHESKLRLCGRESILPPQYLLV